MSVIYKREGYAQTRDALRWAVLKAPNFKFGLTLEDVFSGIEHGYKSVRPQLKEPDRIAQWEVSLQKLRRAYELFKAGGEDDAIRSLQEAEELFTTLRRIGDQKTARQQIGDTESGANKIND